VCSQQCDQLVEDPPLLVLAVRPERMTLLLRAAPDDRSNEVHELLVGLSLDVEEYLNRARRQFRLAEDIHGPVPDREGLKGILASTHRLRSLAGPPRPERVGQLRELRIPRCA
jgi:hypothetical protein